MSHLSERSATVLARRRRTRTPWTHSPRRRPGDDGPGDGDRRHEDRPRHRELRRGRANGKLQNAQSQQDEVLEQLAFLKGTTVATESAYYSDAAREAGGDAARGAGHDGGAASGTGGTHAHRRRQQPRHRAPAPATPAAATSAAEHRRRQRQPRSGARSTRPGEAEHAGAPAPAPAPRQAEHARPAQAGTPLPPPGARPEQPRRRPPARSPTPAPSSASPTSWAAPARTRGTAPAS